MANNDIAIINGRVIDPETELDSVRNVGIANGKITIITQEEVSGEETIDARRYVVAPGFIVTHVHSVGNFWGSKVTLRDGLTTGIAERASVFDLSGYRESPNFPLSDSFSPRTLLR